MYTTKKTAPEKNSPFNLHEQDQGAPPRVTLSPFFYRFSYIRASLNGNFAIAQS